MQDKVKMNYLDMEMAMELILIRYLQTFWSKLITVMLLIDLSNEVDAHCFVAKTIMEVYFI